MGIMTPENIYETCPACKGGGGTQHEGLIEHIIEHIKNWASQNQDGLSAHQVAEAVVRMCNDAIAELEAFAALTDEVLSGEEALPSTDKGRHPDDPEFDAVCDALWDKHGV